MGYQRLMFHRWRADKAFAELSAEARDLWYGLMGICDTWGCLKVGAIPIRNEVYSGLEVLPSIDKVETWIGELTLAGFLQCWNQNDKTYGELKWFMEEQRLRHRSRRETPCPPWRADEDSDEGGDGAEGPTPTPKSVSDPDTSDVQRGNSSCISDPVRSDVQRQNSRCRTDQSTVEEKGREEKRREEKKEREQRACQEADAPGGRVFGSSSDVGEIPTQSQGEAGVDIPEVPPYPAFLAVHVQDWGMPWPETLWALARASPERVLAWALGMNRQPEIKSPWAALRHAINSGWCPTDRDLARAKELLYPQRERTARLDGLGPQPIRRAIGEVAGRIRMGGVR